MHAKSIRSCPTLYNPRDCSPPGSSVLGVSQARILERVAISSSRGSSRPRDLTHVSCIGRWGLYHCATWEVLLCWVLGPVFIILNFSEFTLDMDKSHMELHNKLISPQTNYHWVAGELVSTRRLREKQWFQLVAKENPQKEAGLEVDVECKYCVTLGQQRSPLRWDKHRGTKASKYSGRFGTHPVDQSSWTLGNYWEVN